ncbi:quercetin 2,3-dioxygenase [Scenedesmus sp. PABB004]|nr:quercetin 2,3-dioxygenase [Scenedesmus sp. PABB004]
MAPLPLASLRHIPAASLHVSKPTWWLESRFHFSFADWWDPARQNFGALRVVNDDIVAPRAGFGYVLDGSLSHADSMGSKESLPRGCIQYMSAGTGVTHSEMNDHADPCRFIQVWITPDRGAPGYGAPKYGSTRHAPGARRNRLLHLLGGTTPAPAWPRVNGEGRQALHADANVFVCESDAGDAHDLELGPGRQAYLLCMEGSLAANERQLGARDAAEVRGAGAGGGPTALSLVAGEGGAHFMIIEMALAAE